MDVEWLTHQKDGRKVPMVFNYGCVRSVLREKILTLYRHGSAGYECSWGSADIAIALLEGALSRQTNGN